MLGDYLIFQRTLVLGFEKNWISKNQLILIFWKSWILKISWFWFFLFLFFQKTSQFQGLSVGRAGFLGLILKDKIS
jgi:hypothetical protein